jgi:uncharacterized protein
MIRHWMVLSVWGLVSAVCYLGLYRWLCAAFPRWLARHRVAIIGTMAVAFALPFARELIHGAPATSLLARVVGGAMVWQIALLVAMIVLFLTRALLRIHKTEPGRREVLERVGGTLIVGTAASVFGWGMLRSRYAFCVTEVPVRIARLPKRIDGFTIVQVSDLHIGPFVEERLIAEGFDLALGLHPDLIVVTGDLLDYDPRYVPVARRQLARLRAPAGVACILGNHDYYAGRAEVARAVEDAGAVLLVNRGKVILPEEAGGFALLGVDDPWAGRTEPGRGADLDAALATVPPDRATVLLAHQPNFVRRVIGKGIDLMLSGHTHGGQINPGFALARMAGPYVAGRYDVEGTVLYVNRGLGTAGPPARLGAPPEITKIVLVSS